MTRLEDENERNNIEQNVRDVMRRVKAAAERSGRRIEDITVIGVTKTIDIPQIQQMIDSGIHQLGENKVQELCSKYDVIGRDCEWHLIGHLQTNKVKNIVDKVKLIHSVDSIELLKEIEKRAERLNRVVDVLLQVNVSGEITKSGISPGEVRSFLQQAAAFHFCRVRGLMTIAPHDNSQDSARKVFAELHKIFIDIKMENTDNISMDYLSMGMSNDFEIAIEEGSNMVRVGTAIFGQRNYEKNFKT